MALGRWALTFTIVCCNITHVAERRRHWSHSRFTHTLIGKKRFTCNKLRENPEIVNIVNSLRLNSCTTTTKMHQLHRRPGHCSYGRLISEFRNHTYHYGISVRTLESDVLSKIAS